MTILDETAPDGTGIEPEPQPDAGTDRASTWRTSACILCECNCGVEIRIGTDGHTFERVRGDKAHPASRGYTCEKALRLDHYQNGRGERVLNPLRRRDDGTYEEVDWDTAVREVAERLAAVRDEYGGDKIVYYGGGGQGNHLGGAYGGAMHRGFGGRFRSSAIAQEKSGEVWVNGVMFGNAVRGEFDECEVAFFVGKNPWMSHGVPRARTTLKAIANDDARSMVVIDPRVTETAELADFHLQVSPGRDAWLLSAMVAIVVQEGLSATTWLAEHASGFEAVVERFSTIDIAAHCRISGVDEDLVRRATRRIASASSVAVFEDLGTQMNRHSTLVSYLEKLVWTLTGNFANHGGQQIPSSMVPLVKASTAELDPDRAPRSPVAGERILGGLVPCNVIPEEILTDHPDRYRAMIVESGNPAHSIADSARMREALRALDFVLVIDVFMTETAREAHYVLPATTQFEKFESTFFNFEFPKNVFQLRRPVVEAPAGPLGEPEIHARILEAAGLITDDDVAPLRAAAEVGRTEFAEAFGAALAATPSLGVVAPVLLYRTLGPTLPHGASAAAALWAVTRRMTQMNPMGVQRAGFGDGPDAADRLFDAIIDSPSGLVITDDDHDASWRRLATPDGLVQLAMPELLSELDDLGVPPGPTEEWPFLLSAGERRSFTANTIFRDPAWRRRAGQHALRIGAGGAGRLGGADGDGVRSVAARGEAA
ncbi:MAG: molybdopterin-dependent oxidoreductase, partial [Ilumatobacter sp.]|uniref:molybdopterin-dependent oxidoreductase n=1 Tax=Ilumatobacter sp. TaxID=1967498 RepID=UPI003298B89D